MDDEDGFPDDDEDDNVEEAVRVAPEISRKPKTYFKGASLSSLRDGEPGRNTKKARLSLGGRRWKRYLGTDHSVYRGGSRVGPDGNFGSIHIMKTEHKSYVMQCMKCQWKQTGAIGIMIDHLENCELRIVEDDSHEEHRQSLKPELSGFRDDDDNYCKDTHSAAVKLEVINPSEPMRSKDAQTRRMRLLQLVSRASLACNWSPSQAESQYFRQMLLDVSQLNLSVEDADILGHIRVADTMEEQAKDIQQKARVRWTQNANKYGGSFTIDGWTARNSAMVGLVLFSLGVVYHEDLLRSGKITTAEDYLERIVPVLPMALISSMCTDGASNMIKLGDIMTSKYFVLPQLCAGHGFSLVNHYIAKCFEGEYGFISKIMGVASFFNRSPQRMELLRELSTCDLGLIGVPKTRLAYMTFAFLRVIRLRSFAQIAMTRMTAPKTANEEQEFDDDSKFNKVRSTLNDNLLFDQAELFVRLTFPVVLIMREFDRGAPMTGFVFWAHVCIESHIKRVFDALGKVDPSQSQLRDNVLKSTAWIWGKRHTPMLSFAYLTNPLFHKAITEAGCRPYHLADHFPSDVKVVLNTMIKKRFPDIADSDRLKELCTVLAELDQYFSTPLDELQVQGSKMLLASEWWNGHNATDFPALSYYATRVHSAPCVSSSLERQFSMTTNDQTTQRPSVTPKRAALFTAAHHEMMTVSRTGSGESRKRSMKREMTTQERIVDFVKRLEKLLDSEEIPEIDAEGIRDVENWMASVTSAGESLIYNEGPVLVRADEAASEVNSQPGAGARGDSTMVLAELEADQIGIGQAVSRVRHPPNRYLQTS